MSQHKEVYWSFMRESDGLSEDGLTYSQAKFIYNLVPKADRDKWLVWCEAWLDWMPLDECELLGLDDIPMREPPTPPNTKRSAKTGKSPQDVLSNAETKVLNKRMSRRFVKYWQIEVISGSNVFKTTTINVSIGGMLLEGAIPANFGDKVKVRITRRNGDQLEMFCAVIKTPDGHDSKRLRITGLDKEGLLRNWLTDQGPY